MADVVFMALTLALFALAALLVMGCDRIIGPGEDTRDTLEAAPRQEAA